MRDLWRPFARATGRRKAQAFCAFYAGLAAAGIFSTPGRAQEPDPRYWRLAEVSAQFDAWERDYPGIFHPTSIGISGEGEPILAARISDHAAFAEAEPRLLFHAAQHANECNGTGAIMKSMENLLAGYGSVPGITARVDALELWFIPIANPDGHAYVFSGAPHWADWRKTLRDYNGNGAPDYPGDGVDMNRNWDWYWDEYSDPDPQYNKGPYPFSEREVTALRAFVLSERPVIVVDYHSPDTIGWSNIIFYPWLSQHGGGQSPDYEVAQDIAGDWAYSTLTPGGQHFSSLFGYDTLPKEQCWVYGRAGILTFVMEISDQLWWTGAVVDSIAARVARGSATLVDRVLEGPGISGRVTDAHSGAALVAEVRLDQMHDPDVGPRLTEARYGMYQRLTEPGSYTVRVSCEGYASAQRQVQVASAGWAKADFALLVDPTTAPGLADTGSSWFTLRNPLRAGEGLSLTAPSDLGPLDVDLMDASGRRAALLGSGLPAGRSQHLVLPDGLAAGVYLIRARSAGEQQVQRLILLP